VNQPGGTRGSAGATASAEPAVADPGPEDAGGDEDKPRSERRRDPVEALDVVPAVGAGAALGARGRAGQAG